MSKIMNVFYGADTLPYKDKECTVHFPIIGQTFAGSSLVDTIKFYVGKIGGIIGIEWLAVVKRADGSLAYQELESNSDTNGSYVTLPLASYYTEKKGDLYITLNGYQGGVTVTQDEDNIWHIAGTPIVQVAGAVKLTIAYAPVLPQDAGALETISVQEALGLVASKLDKDSPYFMKVVSVSNINDINTGIYGQYLQNGDIFYEKNRRTFYKIVSGEFGTFVTELIEFVLDSLQVDELNITSSITIPDSFNDIFCVADDIGLKDYIDNGLSLKANASETYTKTEVNGFLDDKADKSTTYTKTEINAYLSAKADKSNTYTKTEVDDAILQAVSSTYKYKGSVSTYEDLPTTGLTVGDVYNVEDTGDNYAWTGSSWDKLGGTIDLSGYATTSYVNGQLELKADKSTTYTKTEVDNALSLKANASALANYVPTSRTIAGIGLSTNISSQSLTDALIFMNTTTDIDYIMGD